MPKRTDIHSILLIGSGPIVIGQASEFDYSGTQACKVLREEGYRVVLVNSNPATIMTDPEIADATYIEPITPESVESVIEREHPDALLPTMGGQTALNVAVALAEGGMLNRHGVQLIGANLGAIKRAEDRKLFQEALEGAGVKTPRGRFVRSVEEGVEGRSRSVSRRSYGRASPSAAAAEEPRITWRSSARPSATDSIRVPSTWSSSRSRSSAGRNSSSR